MSFSRLKGRKYGKGADLTQLKRRKPEGESPCLMQP